VDLAGRDGEAVRAAGAGVVTFAGAVAGVGVVTVAHGGGLRTTYEPVTPVVSARWRVRPGDVIATLGSGHPDCPAAACLHWGLLRGTGRLEAYLDPLMLLGLTRPRLLPLVAAVGVGGGAA
jgi:murein DD-endopeptidase MepM/ murein hydrolase activator NlpD